MKKKILVIDDEEEICDLMSGWLDHLGYEVLISPDGDDGLWKIKSQKPDLIITDALMPGRTGHQLIDQIKTLSEEIQKIPIIMISARESMRDERGQVFAFVSKPFSPKDMLSKIRQALKET